MGGLNFLISSEANAVRFELAGSLCGVDVETVHQAWQREAFADALRPVIVDITSITEADQHGRALLVIMHRFGSQIIAKSSPIAQRFLTDLVRPAFSKPGWFKRLVRFLWNDRHTEATFPPQAEMICRMPASQWLIG